MGAGAGGVKAVTRQLRALERELGAILVTRTSRGIALTPVGAAVLPYARQAGAAVRACRHAAAEASAAGAHRLAIGAGLMVALYVLPPVVGRFRALRPDVAVELRPGHHREAVRALLDYEVDLAVIATTVDNPLLTAHPVLTDPLLLVSAPSAPPPAPPPQTLPADTAGRAMALSRLDGATLLVLPQETGLREQIEGALTRAGVTCRLVPSPTAETIKSAVALGMGVTILPASAVRDEVAQGRLASAEIADWPEGRRVVSALRRTEGRPSPQAGAFLALLRERYRSPAVAPATPPAGERTFAS